VEKIERDPAYPFARILSAGRRVDNHRHLMICPACQAPDPPPQNRTQRMRKRTEIQTEKIVVLSAFNPE